MLYLVNVTIHVFAALLWLGGMFFLAAVGAPVLRRVEDPVVRRDLFRVLGERFRKVGWVALAVLVLTGTLNLWFRDLLRWDVLGSAAFWGSRYGVALGWKLASVAVMLAVQAVHDFVVGPASSRVDPDSAAATRLRRRAALLARASALAGVVLVIAAVRLARMA
jgi:putative copper resistance protein D